MLFLRKALKSLIIAFVLCAMTNNVYASAEKIVVLYGTSWCAYCKKARQYFQDNNIEYTDYDIKKSDIGKKKFEALNGYHVPLIMIGPHRIEGFKTDSIQHALKAQGLLPRNS